MATATDWSVGTDDDLWTQVKRTAGAPAPQPSAPAADSGWDVLNPTPAAPAAVTPTAPTPPAAAPSPYAPLIAEATATPDSTQRVVAQDSLGWKLYTDLAADGHEVAWQDGQLVVDGKPYTVAGDTAPRITAARREDDDPPGGGGPDPHPTPSPTPGPTVPDPPGTDYGYDYYMQQKDWQKGFEKMLGPFFQNSLAGKDPLRDPNFAAVLTRYGFKIGNPNAAGEITKIQTPDGHWVRVLGGPKGGYYPTWVDNGPEGSGGASHATDGAPPIDFSQWIEEMMRRVSDANAYSPTPIDESTIPWLQHPETFSPELVDELKSKQSEAQMTAGQLADEDLARFGAAHDLGGSPWLAAGRAGNLYGTRQNIIGGNRDVDVTASMTNAVDRMHAAGMIIDIDKFNEGIKQQAVQLGLSAASLRAQVVATLLSLWERQQEFGGSLGLSYDELQRLLNNDAWDRAKTATGG